MTTIKIVSQLLVGQSCILFIRFDDSLSSTSRGRSVRSAGGPKRNVNNALIGAAIIIIFSVRIVTCEKMKMNFKERYDIYGGVTVSASDLADDQKQADLFSSIIAESLNKWRKTNIKGVWIRIEIKDSQIIPVLVEKGFEFHHTQPNYLVMTKWLPDTPSTLPRYAHTVIGVGGLVIDSENRILLMKEKRGRYLGWKFPGGASEPGESIFDTAVREVFEETGIRAAGKAILCFRQLNVSQYENVGDIYFMCLMDAIGGEIKACPRETADCKWFTRPEIELLPENEFHEFHCEILRRYDKWKASGRRGCHISALQFSGRNCKMFFID
ncbi:nudix (nucleoside diphosphate linked moiety X)-type motif 6 [Parelaphostrongylus tenuis]|uniref:Nudix (Nucleoside diphosphate linked moiety X)-type motif 6 n=1 Tax=Parelaphostrongylus tenuis TaxID=148309 RepID=A0AAD5RAS3_PARTN|nr:nudix (nucleoside diphosphate linked moiety X)-type motif 6 [Parelaphostrongylus tenuis]